MRNPFLLFRLSKLMPVITVIITLAMAQMSCTPTAKTADLPEINTLDSLIDITDEINRTKLLDLMSLQKKREKAVTNTDKYLANSMLFDGYYTYQSDSAFKYVDQNLMIANEVGNTGWEIESKIDKAGLLAATGMLSQAVDLMNSIDRQKLPEEMLVDYYGQMIFIYSHYGNFAEGFVPSANEYTNNYYLKEREYKDSVMMVISSDHPEYLWYKGWDALGSDKPVAGVIDSLVQKLRNGNFDTHQEAKDAYVLAKLFEINGDNENFKKYIALSAIADVRIANAEISSLQELAKELYNEGDIDHAYSYINYSLNKAIQLPNRVKAYSITTTLGDVYEANKSKIITSQQRTRISLIAVCVLAVILIVFTIVIRRQNLKLSHQRNALDKMNQHLSSNNKELADAQHQLNDANQKLQELNEDLLKKNKELEEVNYVKEEYIGYVFTICSNYIGKLEALKNKIHSKALAKQYNDIEKETANFNSKEEMRDFYKSFDTMFLNIYPGFIEDFNALLQDDKGIYPKDGELLNTELRIYALVRLGITDSIKIADFLHCSPQTVYNYRLKTRNKAKIPKEDFADTVRTLGTFRG